MTCFCARSCDNCTGVKIFSGGANVHPSLIRACLHPSFHIRSLRHIRPSLTEDMPITVAVSMVHSRLDYANSLIHGHTNVKRLQSVQNSAARVVLKYNHHLSSGDLLRKLHWLPVQSRIEFEIACITYKVVTTPANLLEHFA